MARLQIRLYFSFALSIFEKYFPQVFLPAGKSDLAHSRGLCYHEFITIMRHKEEFL